MSKHIAITVAVAIILCLTIITLRTVDANTETSKNEKTSTSVTVNDDLKVCAQALHDTRKVVRAYFDAIRNYESAYILNEEPASSQAIEYAQQNEQVGDELYEQIWQDYVDHCDQHVTDRIPERHG